VIANVRFKVQMRLRAFVQGMGVIFSRDEVLRAQLRNAQDSSDVAAELKTYWTDRLKQEFPGCRVECSPNRIYLTLPDNYPASGVPISEVYPAAFKPALFGVSAKPDF
jgi:hypothetical protein